jgi:hypothetical protein
MINLTTNTESGVHPKLARRLRDARAYGALLDVHAPRFVRFLMQPRAITRNGWLVDPQMNLEQSSERTYILPVQGDRLGQRLRIDRLERKAHLHTYAEGAEQEITVDMESMAVLDNRYSNH